jgi:hypothetical protein
MLGFTKEKKSPLLPASPEVKQKKGKGRKPQSIQPTIHTKKKKKKKINNYYK